jgi:phage terminase large subunit GpA-like protein
MGVDSRGEPGVTAQAYTAWRRWKKAKRTRRIGVISGRDAWTIILTGGASALLAPRLQVVYPDTARKASAASQNQVPVASFNPNLFKDDLAGQLAVAERGPFYVNFPYALRSERRPHAFFEQATAEHQVGARWEKKVSSAKNEALDQLVGTHVLAHLHGLSRLDWAKPPSWAAPWDLNSYVQDVAELEAEQAAAEAAAAAPADPDASLKKKRSLATRLA